jgi:tetratricopeptide (TPR) repeat protein
MNPAIIFFLVRLVIVVARSRSQASGARPWVDGVHWALLVWILLGPMGISLLGMGFSGQPLLFLPAAVILALTFPWPIAQLALIPLGLHRAAYYLTITSDLTFRADRRGGAALAAAWAIARRPVIDEDSLAWVESKLALAAPLRGGSFFAAGLLLAARGDMPSARSLIEAALDLDPRACPSAVRRLASGWLAADAAERGDWDRVGELGLTLRGGGRQAYFLSAVTRALRLEPTAPSTAGLWLRWALAPRRAETLPILRRALAARRGAFIESDSLDDLDAPLTPALPSDPEDDLGLALSLHAAMLARPRGTLTGHDLRALAEAWDGALEGGATARAVDERALSLGAPSGKLTLERIRDAVMSDLSAVVHAGGERDERRATSQTFSYRRARGSFTLADLGERGAMAAGVRRRVRDDLLREIEAQSDAVRRRVEDKRELSPVDELREWLALRESYERGVRLGGMELRRLAFHKVNVDACSLAVWLFNDRSQRPLGNAIFCFLLREANAVDAPSAIALHTKNVGCGV